MGMLTEAEQQIVAQLEGLFRNTPPTAEPDPETLEDAYSTFLDTVVEPDQVRFPRREDGTIDTDLISDAWESLKDEALTRARS
jgi:hypothetical protein